MSNNLLNVVKLASSILDTELFIKQNVIKPVISQLIYETTSVKFHPEGLFSESIFGSQLSEDRLTKFGYIDLNCEMLHPIVYVMISKLKPLYLSILSGDSIVKFDDKIKDFVLDNEGETGFMYFISHIYKLKPAKPESKIKLIYWENFNKYQQRKNLTTRYQLVIPAGIREIVKDTVTIEKDSINAIYLNILSLTLAINPGNSDDMVYDIVKSKLQKKLADLYNYITRMLSGDSGFLSNNYGDRAVAYGTRNVLSIDIKDAVSSNDVENIGPNDVKLSLQQGLIAYMLKVIYVYKTIIESHINSISKVGLLTNAKTLLTNTVHLSIGEIDKHIQPQFIEKLINEMSHEDFKNSPVTFIDKNKNKYYIMIKYDLGSIILYDVDFNSLKARVKEQFDIDLTKDKVAPITYGELFYTILYSITTEKNTTGVVTRYPAIQEESIKPLYTKIGTTEPGRKVIIYYSDTEFRKFPSYPILGKKYMETIITNSLVMQGHNSDVDGDMESFIAVLSEDGNIEVTDHIQSPSALYSNTGDFQLIPKPVSELVLKAMAQ